jgi:ribA/ribD-fused uncharacterized protein
MHNSSIRKYNASDSSVIYKTKDAFGGLSNMASGYPIQIYETCFKTSEALYQACKFPWHPDIQREIAAMKSPMTAKMKAIKNSEFIRKDWDKIKVPIMRWSLNMKLCYNYEKFSALLLSTGNKAIVEYSEKDIYWGARKEKDQLIGTNALGRLLMELREKVIENDLYSIFLVTSPNIPDFTIFGVTISEIDLRKEYFEKIIAKLKIKI